MKIRHRNKQIAEDIHLQVIRLGLDNNLTSFVQKFIVDLLDVGNTISVDDASAESAFIRKDIDFIETLKIIGIMEVSKDKRHLLSLLNIREHMNHKSIAPKELATELTLSVKAALGIRE